MQYLQITNKKRILWNHTLYKAMLRFLQNHMKKSAFDVRKTTNIEIGHDRQQAIYYCTF